MRIIKCPGCGTQGALYPFDNAVFVNKGKLLKKNIAKCKKCGCGIMYGKISYRLLGRVLFIPTNIQKEIEIRFGRFFLDEYE